MNQSPHRSAPRTSQREAGSPTPGGTQPDDSARPYRHSWNRNGGIDSICQRCRTVIASSLDEWSLLVSEERHVCGAQSNSGTAGP